MDPELKQLLLEQHTLLKQFLKVHEKIILTFQEEEVKEEVEVEVIENEQISEDLNLFSSGEWTCNCGKSICTHIQEFIKNPSFFGVNDILLTDAIKGYYSDKVHISVPSETTDHQHYIVDIDKCTCTCPHFKYKGPLFCKHMDYVLSFSDSPSLTEDQKEFFKKNCDSINMVGY